MDSSPHVTHGDILLALDGELEPDEAARITAHLEACWSCRARRDRVHAATRQVVDYRELRAQSEDPPRAACRALFLAALADSHSLHRPIVLRAWDRVRGALALGELLHHARLRPSAASAMLVMFAVVLLVGPGRTWAAARHAADVAVRIIASWFEPRRSEPPRPVPAESRVLLPPKPVAETPSSTRRTVRRRPEPVIDPAVLVGLEVEALARLQRAGALMGEQVSVERRGARVRIDALVESVERQKELEAALGSLRRDGPVDIAIKNAQQEVLEAPGQPDSPLILRDVEVPRDRIAAFEQLRRFFTHTAGWVRAPIIAIDVDSQVRAFADRVLTRSREARYHVLALQRLANRFEPDALQRLNAEAFGTWRAMVTTEARAVGSLAELLRLELAPVFAPGPVIPSPDAQPSMPNLETRAAAERLVVMTEIVHDAIRAAVTVSTSPSGDSVAIETDAFWRDLAELESLARFIAHRSEIR